MANLFDNAAARHLEILQSHAATSVTYRRGSDELVGITFTRASANRMQDLATGEMTWHDQDWIAEKSLLDTLGEPQRGDEIVVGGETFQVLPPEENTPCWQWYGNQRKAYRIHSERTKNE